MKRYARELSLAIAIVTLGSLLALVTPGFFSFGNIRDLTIANLPILIVALGMTLVILTGQIDISVGSQFAICSVVAGVTAKTGAGILASAAAACAAVSRARMAAASAPLSRAMDIGGCRIPIPKSLSRRTDSPLAGCRAFRHNSGKNRGRLPRNAGPLTRDREGCCCFRRQGAHVPSG